MKNWLDRYRTSGEVKGANIDQLNFRCMVITSNYRW